MRCGLDCRDPWSSLPPEIVVEPGLIRRAGRYPYYAEGPRADHRDPPVQPQALISGPALASTCALVSGASKPWLGVGLCPMSRSMAAAWRASICTMLPAA